MKKFPAIHIIFRLQKTKNILKNQSRVNNSPERSKEKNYSGLSVRNHASKKNEVEYLKCWKKKITHLEFYTQWNFLQMQKRNTDCLWETNTEGIHWQITCPARNIKRCSSEKTKVIWVRSLDLHKEKNIREWIINEGKVACYFFLFLVDLIENYLK